MRLFRFLREVGSRRPFLLASNVALLASAHLLDAASIFTLAAAVDVLAHPDLSGVSRLTTLIVAVLEAAGLPASLGSLFGSFLALFGAMNLLQILARWALFKTKHAVLRGLYLGTFSDFFRARWPFFTGAAQGTLVNTFFREMPLIGEAFGALALLASSVLQLGIYLAVPLALAWKLTAACIAAIAACSLPFWALGRWSYRLGQLNTAAGNRVGQLLQENLALAKLVLGFGNGARAEQALAEAYDTGLAATVKSQTLALSIGNLYQPIGMAVLVGALLGARRLEIPFAESIVVLLYLMKSIPVIGQLATHKNNLDLFFPSYEQMLALREKAVRLRRPEGGRRFSGLREGVRFDGVKFAHHGRPPALDGVTVAFPKGARIAIVGESGSGKSTFVDLLLGLLEPQQGAVFIDGAALGELDGDSYRRRLGYVPQESALVRGSIRDNLLWALAGASDDELHEALERADAAEFVSRLPRGLDTPVGDRGVRLSGGQVQRVALARALLRKPDLLILDEATSSVDAESERLIQRAVEALGGDTTIVTIAHRLSTIVNADRIHVLERGRFVEEGSYDELMARQGRFWRLARLQALEADSPEPA